MTRVGQYWRNYDGRIAQIVDKPNDLIVQIVNIDNGRKSTWMNWRFQEAWCLILVPTQEMREKSMKVLGYELKYRHE